MTDKATEAVIRALRDTMGFEFIVKHPQAVENAARNAITAYREHLKAEGLVVVPRDPTNKMLDAAAKAMSPERRPTQRRISVKRKHAHRYRAMIQAAEKTDAEEEYITVTNPQYGVYHSARQSGASHEEAVRLAAPRYRTEEE